jgi:hypothetical protein
MGRKRSAENDEAGERDGMRLAAIAAGVRSTSFAVG